MFEQNEGIRNEISHAKELLVWATNEHLSVLVDSKLYRKPVTREELLYLAHMMLTKAMEPRYD